uniref:transmembrane protein 269 n=1 Tax=Monopterus albus TaxID=43700 RepID=UPI0009B4B159
HLHAACWLVLIGYLLDLADGAVARQLDACSALGAKLDEFADFTNFGIATSLLLRTPDLLDNILSMCYVLTVLIRLCFFSSGIPFMYRGLPCTYSSCILASASLLPGGTVAMLQVIAVAMILFMISQTFYPHDRVLESQAWKKVVYAGGAKLDEFADFTTFGIATSLLLRTPDLLDNILSMCYVLTVLIRLCFFSSGIPFMYRGLPCAYSSCILASASLLPGGTVAMLQVIAVAMILFMISQTFYPHDRVLESQAWKKVVYAG